MAGIAVLLAAGISFAQDKENVGVRSQESDKKADAKDAKEGKESKKDDVADIVDKLDYPELQVVPRASARLKIEAAEEDHNWFYTHWTLEVSGLATIAAATGVDSPRAGLNANDITLSQNIGMISKAIGAGWLITGVVLGFQQPYRSGTKLITHMSAGEKGERAALLRERLAEEALERPAKVMKILTVVSVVTNFAATAALIPFMTDQGRITGVFAATLAFLPTLFEDHSIEVYDKHIEYKKKIYGPLAGLAFGYDQKNREAFPMTQLTWSF